MFLILSARVCVCGIEKSWGKEPPGPSGSSNPRSRELATRTSASRLFPSFFVPQFSLSVFFFFVQKTNDAYVKQRESTLEKLTLAAGPPFSSPCFPEWKRCASQLFGLPVSSR